MITTFCNGLYAIVKTNQGWWWVGYKALRGDGYCPLHPGYLKSKPAAVQWLLNRWEQEEHDLSRADP